MEYLINKISKAKMKSTITPTPPTVNNMITAINKIFNKYKEIFRARDGCTVIVAERLSPSLFTLNFPGFMLIKLTDYFSAKANKTF